MDAPHQGRHPIPSGLAVSSPPHPRFCRRNAESNSCFDDKWGLCQRNGSQSADRNGRCAERRSCRADRTCCCRHKDSSCADKRSRCRQRTSPVADNDSNGVEVVSNAGHKDRPAGQRRSADGHRRRGSGHNARSAPEWPPHRPSGAPEWSHGGAQRNPWKPGRMPSPPRRGGGDVTADEPTPSIGRMYRANVSGNGLPSDRPPPVCRRVRASEHGYESVQKSQRSIKRHTVRTPAGRHHSVFR